MGTALGFLFHHWLLFLKTVIVLQVLGIPVSSASKMELHCGRICNKHNILKFWTAIQA